MAKRKISHAVDSSPVSFEESLNELQSIVLELEEGSLGLEVSLSRFERGVNMLRTCYSILDSAEQRVVTLTQGQDSSQLSSCEATPNSDAPSSVDSESEKPITNRTHLGGSGPSQAQSLF